MASQMFETVSEMPCSCSWQETAEPVPFPDRLPIWTAIPKEVALQPTSSEQVVLWDSDDAHPNSSLASAS